VYIADVLARKVRRLEVGAWSLATLLDEGDRWARRGPVLATFDVPLGIPDTYLAAAARLLSWRSSTFLDFLVHACSVRDFFNGTALPADWKIERPFFSVPVGDGGLRSFESAASQYGVNLYRVIDRRTRAKTLFAKSGIPGTVGAATCALWQELGPRLAANRSFKMWPFEGELDALLKSAPVVLGEVYPRAAYATALIDGPTNGRPRLSVAKTDPLVRRSAVQSIQSVKWVRELEVEIEDRDYAEANEDDFDACLTAAALLRCVLEKLPMTCPIDSPRVEGGILGTGSVNMALRERVFQGLMGQHGDSRTPKVQKTHTAVIQAAAREIRCPIAGCTKTWPNGRGGWDGHVASLRTHPLWHPALTVGQDRKRQFKTEFPEFFG